MSKKYNKEEVVRGVIDFIKDASHDEVLVDVASELGNIVSSAKSAKVAYIYTTVKLDPEIKDKIISKINELIGHTVTVHEIIDLSLLGGVKIKIGDWVYDASIQNQLNSYKSELYANI